MGSELQTMNGQNKLALWAERVSACRSSDQSVRGWCKANGICEQTFYSGADKIYIACGYTDLRRGIDGLVSMVQEGIISSMISRNSSRIRQRDGSFD